MFTFGFGFIMHNRAGIASHAAAYSGFGYVAMKVLFEFSQHGVYNMLNNGSFTRSFTSGKPDVGPGVKSPADRRNGKPSGKKGSVN